MSKWPKPPQLAPKDVSPLSLSVLCYKKGTSHRLQKLIFER
jgi:hypothetical protein